MSAPTDFITIARPSLYKYLSGQVGQPIITGTPGMSNNHLQQLFMNPHGIPKATKENQDKSKKSL